MTGFWANTKEKHFCLKMQLFLPHTETGSLITYQSFVKRSKDEAHLQSIKQWCFSDISFLHRLQFVRFSEYVLHVFDLLIEYAITTLKPKKKRSILLFFCISIKHRSSSFSYYICKTYSETTVKILLGLCKSRISKLLLCKSL